MLRLTRGMCSLLDALSLVGGHTQRSACQANDSAKCATLHYDINGKNLICTSEHLAKRAALRPHCLLRSSFVQDRSPLLPAPSAPTTSCSARGSCI